MTEQTPDAAMVMVPREDRLRMALLGLLDAVEQHDMEDGSDQCDGISLTAIMEARDALAATQQSPISGEGAWGHAYRHIKFEDGLEIPDAPWTLTREDGCFLLLLKGDPEHWEVQPLYAAPPVPSVSGGEDQGSSLRDTHRVAETAVVALIKRARSHSCDPYDKAIIVELADALSASASGGVQ